MPALPFSLRLKLQLFISRLAANYSIVASNCRDLRFASGHVSLNCRFLSFFRGEAGLVPGSERHLGLGDIDRCV